jgi:hypothetical protein
MAYKFQSLDAILSGAISPTDDNLFDIGVSAAQYKDIYINGVAFIDTLGADNDPTTAYIGGGEVDATVIGGETPAAGSFTAVIGTTGVYSGILKTDDATEATSTTDGSLQTDGGLSVVKSAVIGDDLDLLSDGAIMNIGSTSKFTITALDANNAVMATANHRLAFGDAGEYIYGDGTDLKIVSSNDIDVTGDLDVLGSVTSTQLTQLATAAGDVTIGASTQAVFTTAGLLNINNATEATSATDGSLQTDGGLSVVKDAVMGNDLKLLSDSAVLAFGAGGDVTFTHSNDVGVLLNSDNQLQFGDTGTHIAQSADGILKLTSDAEIQLNVGAAGVKVTGTQPKITIGDAGAEDAALLFDGNAQDYRMGLDDGTDKLEFGLGLTFGTTTAMTIDANQVIEAYVGIVPDADDGAYLGTSALGWSDLFLAEGGVINWDNGDMTMTQVSNVLTIAGGTLTATLTNALTNGTNGGIATLSFNGSAADTVELDLNDLTAATVDMSADSIAIVDANDSNATRKESIVDLVAAMAGSGLTATAGVLSSDASPTPNVIGDANATMKQGFNFSTGSHSAARTWTTPTDPDLGDVVVVKAPANAVNNALTVEGYMANTIDDMDRVVMNSNDGAITLTYAVSGSWKIS